MTNLNFKILIIGFGSIGQRHYRNLQALGYREVYVFDIDQKKIKGRNIKSVADLKNQTLRQFQIAIICNPSHLHVRAAIACARAGCHIFVEKPFSHNLKGTAELIQLCQKNKLINMVACNLRFHPCLAFIKKYLDQNKLGKIYSISLEGAYYLPFWRPNSDYRKNYAAKKVTGGGIILDGIHEFDLLLWLNNFVRVKKSRFLYGHISKLQIETEDLCLAIFQFYNKVFGQVKCDYLQKAYSRNCKIVGERGNLDWNYGENVVCLNNEKGSKKLFTVKNFNPNEFYLKEMKYFLSCANKKRRTFNDFSKGLITLKTCLKR